jgi:hypothetical protein
VSAAVSHQYSQKLYLIIAKLIKKRKAPSNSGQPSKLFDIAPAYTQAGARNSDVKNLVG